MPKGPPMPKGVDSLRYWILGVAVASFAAGGVLGHTLCAHPGAVQVSPEDLAYENYMVTLLDLSPEQRRSLRIVLRHADEEEAAILRSASVHELPPPVNNRVLMLHNQTEQYVRALLDDEQRARYDRTSRPTGQPGEPNDHR